MQTEAVQSALFARLVEIGRGSARAAASSPETLYDRHGVLVVRVGDVVVKAHQADREHGTPFLERIRLATALPDLVIAPLGPPLTVDGRTVTVSPFGEPVDPAQDLPWEEGAQLLAALHSEGIPAEAPSWGRPARVARLVARLGEGPAEDAVRRGFATLPAWIRGEEDEPPARREHLIHGDWHLGQMVRARDGHWRLIDIEDMGRGDPAWDLARPAALYSAGVLPPDDWERFLGAYRAARGPAVPAQDDPWTSLDIPARSLAIQIAATCVISAGRDERALDEPEQAMIDACVRISATGDAA
ncbi:phosphotransferase family protein [Actinomadura latina]|uniref:phosphotransferase family protein n=1 Tax=Actinomadura latina TaxID=163603 RepID=UPI00082A5FF7|nr:phosphotransferase [Actinomadura latina]